MPQPRGRPFLEDSVVWDKILTVIKTHAPKRFSVRELVSETGVSRNVIVRVIASAAKSNQMPAHCELGKLFWPAEKRALGRDHEVLQLRKNGMTPKAISTELEVDLSYVKGLLKEHGL